MLPVGVLASLAVAALIEAPVIAVGFYSWSGLPQSLSLWGGHSYQYPVTEWLSYALFLFVPAMMRHNEQTHAIIPYIFRGTEKGETRGGNWIRLLAGVGFVSAILCIYLVFNALTTLAGGPIPDMPEYLTS